MLNENNRLIDESSDELESHKLSCIILTRNEEEVIARCINSVIKVADEIIVCDSGSVDGTIAIATSLGAHVVNTDWPGSHGIARNNGMAHAAHDWCLHLDADEIVDREMGKSIREALKLKPSESKAFCFTRQAEFAGTAIPSLPRPSKRMDLVRLFSRRVGRFMTGMHEIVVDTKERELLPGKLYHWRSFTLHARFAQFNDYSDNEADEIHASGSSFSVLRLIFKPFARFVWHYFFDGSWRVGKTGLIHAMTMAMAEFMRQAKLWERQRGTVEAPKVEYYEQIVEQ